MRDVQEILRLWEQTKQTGAAAVLATVIKTQGSSYRLPGARLLLTQHGERAGSISGGCLEGDLLKKAWWLTENGPAVRRYDTNAEGEIEGGYGLGCNGIIHILLERLSPYSANVLDAHQSVCTRRQPALAVRVLPRGHAAGELFVFTSDEHMKREIAGCALGAEDIDAAGIAFRERATFCQPQGESELFLETLVPAPRLLIFGAGDDVVPMTQMAGLLGWETWVYDGRGQLARSERFPSAHRVMVRPVGSPANSSEAPICVDEWTVAVLMTHSYSQDLDALRQLALHPPRYIGLLGPRKRSLRLLSDAGFSENQFEGGLYGPMGLDIGADGPDQVALAVTSEIQAVLNGRGGGPLRNRKGSIHSGEMDHTPEAFTVGSIACA